MGTPRFGLYNRLLVPHNKNIKSRPAGLDSQSAALSALYVGRYEASKGWL
jgi:hypothetical protein